MLGLELSLRDRISRSNFADIFAPPPGDRVFKLMQKITAKQLVGAEKWIFNAEVGAYERLKDHPELQRYVPEFFGVVRVDRVINAAGRSISGKYCLDLCFSMERLPPDPDELKYGMFFGMPEWSFLEPIGQAFEAAGIRSLGDASVLQWRDGNPKLIDFALYDAPAQHWKWET